MNLMNERLNNRSMNLQLRPSPAIRCHGTGLVPNSPKYLTQHGRNCNPRVAQDRHQISSADGIPLIINFTKADISISN